jgi:hypothetical protein
MDFFTLKADITAHTLLYSGSLWSTALQGAHKLLYLLQLVEIFIIKIEHMLHFPSSTVVPFGARPCKALILFSVST